jgi:hypothetical protein
MSSPGAAVTWKREGKRHGKRETYPCIVRSMIRSCKNIKDKESEGKRRKKIGRS